MTMTHKTVTFEQWDGDECRVVVDSKPTDLHIARRTDLSGYYRYRVIAANGPRADHLSDELFSLQEALCYAREIEELRQYAAAVSRRAEAER
jgi:hypothetical protein